MQMEKDREFIFFKLILSENNKSKIFLIWQNSFSRFIYLFLSHILFFWNVCTMFFLNFQYKKIKSA